MPKMLSYGAVGQDVRDMQSALNKHRPSALAPLAVDGIFGSRGLARVKEFQGNKQLTVDGIVGPNTWNKLLTTDPTKIAGRVGIDCGTHDVQSRALGENIARQFFGSAKPSTASTSQFRFGQSTPKAVGSSANPFRFLNDVQKATAKSVYGNSLDFSRIFISNKTGIGGRPFTTAFPESNQIVQIMNCGTFTPSKRLLVHELCHVWQSQHHNDQFKFMGNAIKCQGKAVANNTAETFVDPDVLLHKDHPVQFPFSAYAYKPGLRLGEYAAEQMANAVEHGEAGVVSHVKSVAMNVTDSGNVTALDLTTIGDRRLTGMKF